MDEASRIEELEQIHAAHERGDLSDDERDAALAALEEGPEAAGDEPTPASPETIATLEALEKEATRHEKALVRILGEGATDRTCATCDGVGYIPPGQDAPDEPNDDDDAQPCPKCEGWGVVKTGSIKPGHEVRDCNRCAGRGYLERMPEAMQPTRENGGGGGGENEFGVPPWMGDPNVRPLPVG